MTDEQSEMLKRMDEYWFKKSASGQPSRSAKFDQMLKAYDRGVFSVRAILWLGGLAVAIATGWDKIKSVVMGG